MIRPTLAVEWLAFSKAVEGEDDDSVAAETIVSVLEIRGLLKFERDNVDKLASPAVRTSSSEALSAAFVSVICRPVLCKDSGEALDALTSAAIKVGDGSFKAGEGKEISKFSGCIVLAVLTL